MPLTGRVLQVAHDDPRRTAIVADGERLTYAGLVADSRRMFAAVGALREAARVAPAAETGGIPITAVSATSAFHTARIMAGLAGYRAVSATIDPRWPLDHQVGVVTSAGIGVVISDSDALGPALAAAGWRGRLVSLAEFRDLETAQAPVAEAPAVRAGDEPFLLLFSSGTTRNPKAFLKTRAQYRANFEISSAHLEPLPGVVTLAPGPVSYSLTLYALIECLASGGTACLADSFDPIEAGRTVAAQSVSRVVAVPAMAAAIALAARRDPERFASLRLIVTGGANLSAATRARLHEYLPAVRLISYYGAAEIGFIGDSRSGDGTAIDVYDGVDVQVRGDDGREVPGGELGTVWVRAEACSTGYVAATADEVLRGPDGWATVHDQGRMVAGRLSLAGRAGDIAITGGHKVSLAEVERAFAEMPGLPAVCAVALPDERRGSVIALMIETGGGAAPLASLPTVAELTARGRSMLAPQFVPHRWYRVGRLPRTVGGKIRRGAAAEMIAAGEGARL